MFWIAVVMKQKNFYRSSVNLSFVVLWMIEFWVKD